MSVSTGLSYLAIPGPSVVPDRVLRAMHRASPNIYEGELVEMVPGLIEGLKRVAGTQHHGAIYITNGHGTWEASLINTLAPGDKVLVPATGSFAHGWAGIARSLGIEVEILEFGKRAPVDPAALQARLAADSAHDIKAVLAVHTDTSTGIRSDIPAIRGAMDAAGHPALLMADCMASLGCDRFEMDAWGVDVTIAGSQKGLMMTPGLGFVFFNDKADGARDRLERVTNYWDWRPRTNPDVFYHYFSGTAPTQHLYGLAEALAMIEAETLEGVWARHGALAQAIWAAFDHWGSAGPLEINAPRGHRSHSVTALNAGSDKATALRKWCEAKAGLTLGIGLGMAEAGTPEWHHHFRLGHMGHVNGHMILGALATIEAGLKAVDLPHAPGGVVKAAEHLADAL
ncbi:MAG: aminotransferase class V-fold PLP-dependent enzyme [Silicimonas sp.]|nr:aminotransferase class V-fold PLP-dependent enzyme [Silicimonas sp.]